MPLPPSASPPRERRTFELRDAEWIEDAATRRPRLPLWLIIPAVLATLAGFVLIAFATTVALASAAFVALRNRIRRLFRR
jgi:hypothetical protein